MIPVKVTSRNIPLSESMIEAVEMHLSNLEHFIHRLIRCEVVFSLPHVHGRKTRFHHVRIQLKTKSGNIVIDREPERNIRHTTFRLALQDAFHTLERRLGRESRRFRAMKKLARDRWQRRQREDELTA